MIRLEIKNWHREPEKTSILLSGKTGKHEYLICEEIIF